jgi:hypothetical protein
MKLRGADKDLLIQTFPFSTGGLPFFFAHNASAPRFAVPSRAIVWFFFSSWQNCKPALAIIYGQYLLAHRCRLVWPSENCFSFLFRPASYQNNR